jgi:hypothetical protein
MHELQGDETGAAGWRYGVALAIIAPLGRRQSCRTECWQGRHTRIQRRAVAFPRSFIGVESRLALARRHVGRFRCAMITAIAFPIAPI